MWKMLFLMRIRFVNRVLFFVCVYDNEQIELFCVFRLTKVLPQSCELACQLLALKLSLIKKPSMGYVVIGNVLSFDLSFQIIWMMHLQIDSFPICTMVTACKCNKRTDG